MVDNTKGQTGLNLTFKCSVIMRLFKLNSITIIVSSIHNKQIYPGNISISIPFRANPSQLRQERLEAEGAALHPQIWAAKKRSELTPTFSILLSESVIQIRKIHKDKRNTNNSKSQRRKQYTWFWPRKWRERLERRSGRERGEPVMNLLSCPVSLGRCPISV